MRRALLGVIVFMLMLMSAPQLASAADTQDYVDAVSDLHSPSDKGTHDVFSDLQGYGSLYDVMTEANTGAAATNYQDFVDAVSNLHAPTDVGTHSSFAEEQDKDAVYDTLTEADTDSGTSTCGDTSGTGTSYRTTVANEVRLGVYTASSSGEVASIVFYGRGSSATNCKAIITSSGGILLANGVGAATAVSTTAGTKTLTYSAGSRPIVTTGTTYWIGMIWQAAGRVYYDSTTGGTSRQDTTNSYTTPTDPSDAGSTTETWRLMYANINNINYGVDLEVGWTSAQYGETNEQLCVFGGSQDAEALMVDIWNGAGWANVIADMAADWNNVSVSSYLTSAAFEIRFVDARTTPDTSSAGTWQVEAVVLHCWSAAVINYELDLEVGWTGADYDETTELLCIYAVTGGGWPAEDIKVNIWTGSWTQVFADLTPDQWNNVSVATYLTDATVEVQFLGGTEISDTTQNTWEIDAVLLHTYTSNTAPANDQAPAVSNIDDTDNLYAQYKEYQLIVYVSDSNGFADIDYLEVGLWDNGRATEYWRLRYDEDTNTFSEQYDIGTVLSLNTGGSSAVESGNDIDATFLITIDWDHADMTDVDAKCYVIDALAAEDTDWYEVDWEVETRLDYSVAPAVTADDGGTVDRGDLDEAFSLTGTLIYYGSGNDYPPSAQIDVWVSGSEYGTTIGPWSDTTLTSGAFTVTCYADNVVGQDTYTVKPVLEGAGSAGASQYYTTDLTDTYIADRVQVQSYSSNDARININIAAGDHVTLFYDYDNSFVSDGTVTVNGLAAAYSGSNGIWNFGDTKATAQAVTYNTVVYSGGTHGLGGAADQNGQSLQQIWDSLTVSISDPPDQRININANASGIVVSAVYDYDSTSFDGTLTLNSTTFTYAVAGRHGYTVQSASGGTHGISTISANDATFCIWDSLTVTITGPTYQRIDIGANASGIVVSAVYDYDSSAFDGTLTLNSTTFSYGVVGRHGYTVSSASGGTHGITAIATNDDTYCIWDRLIIVLTADDDSVECGTQVNFTVAVNYDYDEGVCNTYKFSVTRQAVHWHTFDQVNKTLCNDTNYSVTYTYIASEVLYEPLYGLSALSAVGDTVTWSDPPTTSTTTTTTEGGGGGNGGGVPDPTTENAVFIDQALKSGLVIAGLAAFFVLYQRKYRLLELEKKRRRLPWQ